MTKSLYYREGFRLVTFGFFCSLYNLASLPSPESPAHKLLFYGGIIGVFGVATFLQESKILQANLQLLDEKYSKEYQEYASKQSAIAKEQEE